MFRQWPASILITCICISVSACMPEQAVGNESGPSFSVRFDASLTDDWQDGRLLLMLAKGDSSEPRFRVGNSADTQLIFGMNVSDWQAGEPVLVDSSAIGFPLQDLSKVPSGKYYAQALLNRYKDFHLANGKTVSLPPDQGEGQQWQRKPGNFYSLPVEIEITAGNPGSVEIVMDQVIPLIEPPSDTEYVKHIRMRSDLLSEFWGEDTYVGAHILLPEGFDENPDARYPLMVFHGHFPDDFGGFRPEGPDPDLEPAYSARFDIEGYNIIQQQEAHDFYKRWISDDFPRFIVVQIQHPTPYYDDSYAVNSASQGPYGDALTYELIPLIEEQFRGVGEGWARFTYGGSTGGWEAMAVQVFYPDEYNGAFIGCPDPIDFREYMNFNIYEDKNAYWYESEFQKLPRPAHRDYLGNVHASQYDYNRLELVLGDKSRSGQQYDIWEARDWETLGPKLEGKLHIYVGDMDNYYLNNAVYLAEEFLESTEHPHYGGEVDYGDRAEHCWNGDQENGNHLSRMRYNTMYLPKIVERIRNSAPVNAPLVNWLE